MTHAIAHLHAGLDTVVNNEPIHRQEGNAEQADLCLAAAEDYRKAITALKLSLAFCRALTEGFIEPGEQHTA